MGIVIFGKEITRMHRYGKEITEVHLFIDNLWRIIWTYVKSCFGKGYWINEMPWSNEDGWRNS